jgi:agmatine deiminase
MSSRDLPAALGFRMPAEWEPHAATWLTWPHNLDSWPGAFDPVPAIWGQLVAALAPGEHVHILVDDEAAAAEVRSLLHRAGVAPERTTLHCIPSNDAWTRDHGPTFVVRPAARGIEMAAVDWDFNAWGGKYPPWDLDAQITARIAAIVDVPLFKPGIILEGGSIEVNGCGTVLTTESCLLNRNRNPHLGRVQIEQVLRDYLGVTKVLWLGDGIAGDDTDGHVDDLARFVDPTTVVTVVEDDPADANYAVLRDNYERLQAMTDQDGAPLRIVTLPMPRPQLHDGHRMPASYANFYIGNQAVVTPTFDDPADAVALRTLQGLFPTRKVVGIYARELVWGLGAFHCVTQQQPGGW